MGVDIENYRQKIGNFQPSCKKHKIKSGINRKQLNFFLDQFMKSKRKEINGWDFFIGMGFYLVIFILISGYGENINSGCTNNKLTMDENMITFSNQSNSNFFWMTSKQINKACHILEGNKRNPGYKYFSWNCDRAFLSGNKLEDLKCYAFRHKPHLICASEVNLVRNEENRNEKSTNQFSSEQVEKVFRIPGYSIILPESWLLYDKARIILYINDELNYKICGLKDGEKHLQTITLEVGFGKSSKHFVNFYYREWKSVVTGNKSEADQVQNLKKLMNIWQRCTETNKDFVSLGDMNLCALNWSDINYNHTSLANVVHNFMLSENCHQLINDYTRIRNVGGVIQRSCLDHITSNCISKMSTPEIFGLSKSDHLGISIIKSSKEIRTSPKTTKKRVYKEFCKEKFLNEIKEAKKQGQFEEIYLEEDIDKATEIFTSSFNSILNRHAPTKVIQNRTNYQPYVTKEIKDTMDKRDQLKSVAAKTGNLEDYEEYKTERNKVTYVMRNTENDENATSNEIWKTAYSVLGSFRSSFPSQVMIFGKLVKKIADLKRNVTENDAEAANDILKMFLSRKEIPPEGFKLKEITTEQMNKLIKGL